MSCLNLIRHGGTRKTRSPTRHSDARRSGVAGRRMGVFWLDPNPKFGVRLEFATTTACLHKPTMFARRSTRFHASFCAEALRMV